MFIALTSSGCKMRTGDRRWEGAERRTILRHPKLDIIRLCLACEQRFGSCTMPWYHLMKLKIAMFAPTGPADRHK
jgi:hypothetical protein